MASKRNKVAAIQMASSPNLGANLLEVEKLVAEAVDDGAGMVVLPENFAFLGKKNRDLAQFREAEGSGRLQDFLRQLARRHGIWIVGGTVPISSENPQSDKVRAACLIMDERGEQVARYDKIHLFDVHLVENDERYAESEIIEPGSEAVVVDSPFGKLGIAVCYDLRFPELFRKLVDRGMEVAVLPAAFTALTGKAHWEALIRARAIENLSYLVAAAQGGYHISGRETWGHSMIVNPWGIILGEVAKGSGYVAQHLDLELLRSTRRSFPSINHRRIRCE